MFRGPELHIFGVVTVTAGPDPIQRGEIFDEIFRGELLHRSPINEFEGGVDRHGGDPGGPDPQKSAPTPTVNKLYGWWGLCNRSANDLMRTIRRDFSKFGNYIESAAGGTALAGIHFDSGPITQ